MTNDWQKQRKQPRDSQKGTNMNKTHAESTGKPVRKAAGRQNKACKPSTLGTPGSPESTAKPERNQQKEESTMDDWGDWHEGDLVRVTFKFALGTVAEGRLERRQDRLVLPWSECDWWNVIRQDGSVCPNLKVEKIDDPDEGCERIADIDEVRVGDVAVFDGIKGKVASVASDSENGYGKLQVCVPGACFARCAWMQDSAFRYALRKRPALPTKSGFYCDRHGDMWIVGRMKGKDGLHAAPLTENDRYLPGKIAVPLETDGMSSYAPFTRVEFMPAKDGE